MNVPGTAEGNWSWQADEADLVENEQPMAIVMNETGRFAG